MSGATAMMMASVGAPGILAVVPGASNSFSASWEMHNDGTYLVGDGLGGAATGPWVAPTNATVAAFYQVKTAVTAGAFSVDPSAGSFIDLSSTRIWSKSSVGTVTFTVTIREKATGIVRQTYGSSIVVS